MSVEHVRLTSYYYYYLKQYNHNIHSENNNKSIQKIVEYYENISDNYIYKIYYVIIRNTYNLYNISKN